MQRESQFSLSREEEECEICSELAGHWGLFHSGFEEIRDDEKTDSME